MTDYLAYKMPDGPNEEIRIAFVDKTKIREFVDTTYDPKVMSFTGVQITANTPNHARSIYEHPTLGEIFFVEEPSLSSVKGKFLDLVSSVQVTSIAIMALTLSKHATSMNNTVSFIARSVHAAALNKNPDGVTISVEKIYGEVLKHVLKTIEEMEYNDGTDD